MARLPRRYGRNETLDRLDSGMAPKPAAIPPSPAMKAPPSKMPLNNAASQKAYSPSPSGLDNRLKMGGSPLSGMGQLGRTVSTDPTRAGGVGSYDIGVPMSPTPTPATQAILGQIQQETDAYRQSLSSPVMPPNLTPQGQEAWGAQQQLNRSQANRSAVGGILSGNGGYAMDPNGMAIPNPQGAPLPNTVQGSYGSQGQPVLRPDGSRMVEPVGGWGGGPAATAVDDQALRQKFTNPQMTDRELAARDAARTNGFEDLKREMQYRKQADVRAKGAGDALLLGGELPKVEDAEVLAEQARRMNLQRADSNNSKWENARQARIESRKARQQLARQYGAEEAALRRARMAGREGGIMAQAFMGMSPDQQVSLLTGGRYAGGSAQDDMYRAQADNLRAQTDASRALLGGAGAGTQPGQPAETVNPSVKLRSDLGIDPSQQDMATGLRQSGANIDDRAYQQKLQAWAATDMEDPTAGLLHTRWNPNPIVLRNNKLRMAIRSGNWQEVKNIINSGWAKPAPDPGIGAPPASTWTPPTPGLYPIP